MHAPDSLNLKIVRKETAFLLKKCFDTEGVLNGSIQFESGLCSNCSQKIEKIFTTARMLGFSLNSLMLQTFPVGQNWETLGNMQACAMKPMNVSGKMLRR